MRNDARPHDDIAACRLRAGDADLEAKRRGADGEAAISRVFAGRVRGYGIEPGGEFGMLHRGVIATRVAEDIASRIGNINVAYVA